MDHKKVATGVLAVFLAAGMLGLFAFTAKASRAAGIKPLEALALAAPGWEQANSNGFGDPGAGEVTALQAFNGYLYAGTHNPIDPEPLFDGAGIFRSPDGVTWTSVIVPGFGVAHDAAPPAILDLALFKSYLYAGTGRGNAAKIYRSLDGLNWAPVVNSGFGDPDTVNFSVLAEYNSYLYVGATNNVNGAQIWRSFSGDSSSWTQVGPESPGSAPASVTALTVFSNTLYAAVEPESDAPLQIWRSYGGDVWETAISDGFGDSDNTMTGGMAVFGGYLYLGGGNAASGARLWRSSNGTNWTAVTPAFGDSNNQKVEMVTIFQNQLYIGARNAVTGIEIWRWTNSTTWEQVNQDGFGDSNNVNSNWSNATASFLGQLYVGTANAADGGELWRMKLPYAVDLSAADAKAGAAGQIINYSVQITNTGSMSDTYDLTLSGQTWTTMLSTSQLNLTPAATTMFTAAVTIPPGALGNAADAVTVTATSQGDPTRSDSTVLTTSVTPVYGVALSSNDAAPGLAGGSVTYSLHITNTGNVADTFDLNVSGNLWASNLSTPSVTLGPSATTSFSVTVDIPAHALGGDSDAATITATSQGDGSKSDKAMVTTSVDPFFGVSLSSGYALSGSAGGGVTYTLHITNTGNVTDTFDLIISGNLWTSNLSRPNVKLGPSATTSFSVTVDIPANALGGESDSVSVSATSQGNGSKSDSALLTTTVMPFFGVILSKDDSLTSQPGMTVTYTLWITNSGNLTDTFNFELAGNLWTAVLSVPSLTLATGESRAFTVAVAIPSTAANLESDSLTITAISLNDGTKQASAVLTTYSRTLAFKCYLPILSRG